MLAKVSWVLKPRGRLVIGFIDRDGPLGRRYLARQAENVFYREATFHLADEVARLLIAVGFTIDAWCQILAGQLPEAQEIEPLRTGYGQCAFVIVTASNRHQRVMPWLPGFRVTRDGFAACTSCINHGGKHRQAPYQERTSRNTR